MSTSPIRRTILSILLLLVFATAACGSAEPIAGEATYEGDPAAPSNTAIEKSPRTEVVAATGTAPTAVPTTAAIEPASAVATPAPAAAAQSSSGTAIDSEGEIVVEHDPSWTLDGSDGRDRVASVLSTTMGPTNDMVATMRRLATVDYEFPTLADTTVVEVEVRHGRDWHIDTWRLSRNMSLAFVSSASRSDAVAIYESALADMGWDIKKREFTQGDVETTNLSGGAPVTVGFGERINIDVQDHAEGGSIVEVRFEDYGDTDLAPSAVGDGWHRPSPIPVAPTFHRFVGKVKLTAAGNHDMLLLSEFRSDDDKAKLLATIESDMEAAGHENVGANDNGFTSTYGDARTWISVNPIDTEQPDIYSSISIEIQQSLIVAADAVPAVASAPAATGDDDAAPADEPAVEAVALVYAAANGPAVNADTNSDELVDHLLSTMATTDDVPGTVARFTLFPASVPTLADARIVTLRASGGIDGIRSEAERFLETEAHVDYQTTTSFDEAQTAHVDTLTANGWTLTQTQSEENDEGQKRVFLTFEESVQPNGRLYAASMRVFIGEGEDVNTIKIDFYTKGNEDLSGLSLLSGWYTSPFADGETRKIEVGISQTRSTEAFIEIGFDERFAGETIASLKPITIEAFNTSAGWAFGEDRSDTTFGGTFEALGADASVFHVDRDASDAYPDGYAEAHVSIRHMVPFG